MTASIDQNMPRVRSRMAASPVGKVLSVFRVSMTKIQKGDLRPANFGL
jgi:hypothetical protein